MPISSTLRLTIEYLNHSWGVGPNTFRGWEKKAAAAAKAALEPPVKESPYDKNVIVNRSLAQARFTGKYLFALYHRQLASSMDTFTPSRARSNELFKMYMRRFEMMQEDPFMRRTCELWEKKARDHDAAQPGVLKKFGHPSQESDIVVRGRGVAAQRLDGRGHAVVFCRNDPASLRSEWVFIVP